MNVSNLFSYFQAGFRGAFQFAVFPLNMIRRFSYSLMATIANRLGQRTITGDTTKTVTTELLKENTHNVVIGIPNPVQPPLRTTVTKTSSDTVINIDLNDDDSKIPVPDVTDGPSKKRSSISEQGEKSETVEKKPRLACQFQFDQSKTSASAQVDTLSASTVPIENQTNVKGNKVERGEFETKVPTGKMEFPRNKDLKATTSTAGPSQIKKGFQKGKADRPRPNYFVGIQVNNPEVRFKVKSLQEKMLEVLETTPTLDRRGKPIRKNIFREVMIAVEKLHFTLHVVHLKDDEDVEKAKQTVQLVWEKFRDEFRQTPMTLAIQGVGNFGKSVIFAKLIDQTCISRLAALADSLRVEFEATDIYGDTKGFEPHMTIAKVSRSDKLRRLSVRKLPEEMWSSSVNEDFGQQKVEELQLLVMQEKDSTGYYKCIAAFPLGEKDISLD